MEERWCENYQYKRLIMENIDRNRILTREQLIGATIAILDFSTGKEQRVGEDWTKYNNIPASQVIAPVEAIGVEYDRARNLLRDLKRKYNYSLLLDVVGKLDVKEVDEFYHKGWWQINMNLTVENCRKKFGVDVETFAWMMSCPPLRVENYENFHEFTSEPSLIYAFEQVASIDPPRIDEWRRKFKRAFKEHQRVNKRGRWKED